MRGGQLFGQRARRVAAGVIAGHVDLLDFRRRALEHGLAWRLYRGHAGVQGHKLPALTTGVLGAARREWRAAAVVVEGCVLSFHVERDAHVDRGHADRLVLRAGHLGRRREGKRRGRVAEAVMLAGRRALRHGVGRHILVRSGKLVARAVHGVSALQKYQRKRLHLALGAGLFARSAPPPPGKPAHLRDAAAWVGLQTELSDLERRLRPRIDRTADERGLATAAAAAAHRRRQPTRRSQRRTCVPPSRRQPLAQHGE